MTSHANDDPLKRLVDDLDMFAAELPRAAAQQGVLYLTLDRRNAAAPVNPLPLVSVGMPLSAALAASIGDALLAAIGRARCTECGTPSPADDLFEPGAGSSWLCQDCEG